MISTATAAVSARTSDGSLGTIHQAANVTMRNRDDDGHEDRRDAIGETLNRRLRPLRLAHQPHDLRQHAGRADRGRLDLERARRLTVAPMTRSPTCFSTGIDSPVSIDSSTAPPPASDDAVHGKALARPDDDHVAAMPRRRSARLLSPSARRTRAVEGCSRAISRSARVVCRLARASMRVAEQDQRDDQDDRFVVDVGLGAARRRGRLARWWRSRVDERRAGADRDQRVHVGVAVSKAGPRAGVEVPAGPRHDHEGDSEQTVAEHVGIDGIEPRQRRTQRRIDNAHRPRSQRVGTVCGVPGGATHQRHRCEHGDDSEAEADQRLAEQITVFACVRLLASFVLLNGVARDVGEPRAVAGGIDRVDQRLR